MCGYPALPPVDPNGAKLRDVFAHAGAPVDVGEEQNRALLPEDVRQELRQHFEDYMWVDRNDECTCTACGATMARQTYFWTHREWITCPACKKRVQARHLRYGHSKLRQEFYAVYWRKSAVSPRDSVVMIGYYCAMDSSIPDPRQAEKVIVPVLVDAFEYGRRALRINRCAYNWESYGTCNWDVRRDVRALGTAYFGHKVDVIVSEGNFRDAILDTPFAGAHETVKRLLEEKGVYWRGDHSELISAIARRPWIEYMAKAGFRRIAVASVWCTPRGVVNPKGKNLRAILKLSRDRYAEVKGKHRDLSVLELEILQRVDRDGTRMRLDEVEALARRMGVLGEHYWYTLKETGERLDRPLCRYLLRGEDDNGSLNRIGLLLDYWNLCRECGIDTSAGDARLPPNLRQAHDRVVDLANDVRQERVNAERRERAESLQGKLDARLPELERRYRFEHNGLILRPARKLTELIEEGNALRHCVGGYVQTYAEGRDVICFLRRAEAPDVPWRTVEFDRAGKRVQDRGYRNDRAVGPRCEGMLTPELKRELDEFWAAFEARRMSAQRKTA